MLRPFPFKLPHVTTRPDFCPPPFQCGFPLACALNNTPIFYGKFNTPSASNRYHTTPVGNRFPNRSCFPLLFPRLSRIHLSESNLPGIPRKADGCRCRGCEAFLPRPNRFSIAIQLQKFVISSGHSNPPPPPVPPNYNSSFIPLTWLGSFLSPAVPSIFFPLACSRAILFFNSNFQFPFCRLFHFQR